MVVNFSAKNMQCFIEQRLPDSDWLTSSLADQLAGLAVKLNHADGAGGNAFFHPIHHGAHSVRFRDAGAVADAVAVVVARS